MPKISKAYGGTVLGDYARSAAPGTVWLRSLFGKDEVQALDDIQRRRGWNELAIVPLSQSPKSMDLLELHFAGDSARWHYLSLNMVAGTLSETWASRKPGLLTESFVQRTVREAQPEGLLPLLSCENPARLSRAEFRVCLLLGQGLSNERIRAELTISLATLRTHLRNIYAKTGSDGHSELLYKLLNFAGNRAELTARRA
jgi:DNA-binding CsgD family transcriptional regulator